MPNVIKASRLLKISVVTPSLNQAATLEQTLRSVHEQDYPNIEDIVIDGGSRDGTVEILRACIGLVRPRTAKQMR